MTDQRNYSQVLEEEKAFHRASVPLDEMPTCTNFFDKWASCFGAFLFLIPFSILSGCPVILTILSVILVTVALWPQVKAVYRYGSAQDCKEKMDDFKFCLTLKSMTPEEKYEAWIQRKAEKTASKRLSDESSENVWEMRR